MTTLTQAFMARDLLREALRITTALVYRETPAADILIVSTPLRALKGHDVTPVLHLAIYEDPVTGQHRCTTSLDPELDAAHRTFKLSRNNLLGFLGLQCIPLLQRSNATKHDRNPHLWATNILQKRLDFGWADQNQHVALSKPLHPRSECEDDSLRNPQPYPRFKVFCDRRTDKWTFARLAPNGRDLAGHGPMFRSKPSAIAAAELDAIREGHLPLNNGPTVVLHWLSIWDHGHTSIHKVLLSSGQYVEISVSPAEEADDELLHTVTLREHNGAEHGGSDFSYSMEDALHHALHRISTITKPTP